MTTVLQVRCVRDNGLRLYEATDGFYTTYALSPWIAIDALWAWRKMTVYYKWDSELSISATR